jgi:SAM-dependent methyltransferase
VTAPSAPPDPDRFGSARAKSFGDDAEAYDRSRPGYPAALVDDLLLPGVTDVLDVGCGTGKLGRLLAARGCKVLGVEPDERMAHLAWRRYGLEVDVAPFEEWHDGGRRFDLVTAAQAWHWVDPHVGAAKAAAVLRHGGRLAIIWNLVRHEPEVRAALDEVYGRLAPELLGGVALGFDDPIETVAGLDETGAFGPQDRVTHRWQQPYTTAEWLDALPTHSDHRAMPAGRRQVLVAAVGEALDSLGGLITVTYDTLLITSVRR